MNSIPAFENPQGTQRSPGCVDQLSSAAPSCPCPPRSQSRLGQGGVGPKAPPIASRPEAPGSFHILRDQAPILVTLAKPSCGPDSAESKTLPYLRPPAFWHLLCWSRLCAHSFLSPGPEPPLPTPSTQTSSSHLNSPGPAPG